MSRSLAVVAANSGPIASLGPGLSSGTRRPATEGYEVAHAQNGGVAIDYLLPNRTPSVILLDLAMPNLSGWDVLALLRRYLR